ncbi:uncharacterized protein LOC108743251 [Agrilus planipennis]|uniref:Uncharacterized protein LOC108743251 n=1 Tax=Agrilus planipennis TaxID=224129 RepID=A0A1W4XN79_AGRPL|nr:uncharacterized protein LOC108743251 [Agrilus planipennis]
MLLTTEKKSISNNRKTDCGGNKSFFTPCKRVGLSRNVTYTSKKITASSCSSSPYNTVVAASEDTSYKLEKNKCNKSLGLTRKSGVKYGLNVSPTLETSFNSSDGTENVTINNFNLNVSATATNAFSSSMTQLCESSKLKKRFSEQISTNGQDIQEEALTNIEEEILQKLTKKEEANSGTVNSLIHNKSETLKETAIENIGQIISDKNVYKKEKESSKMYAKKEKRKIASKSTRKSLSRFFSSKASSLTSDSEDDFISSGSLSQKSSNSQRSSIGNLLQCSLTIERSDVENSKNKKQEQNCEIVKSRPQKRRNSIGSSDGEECASILKKKRSKSIFSNTCHDYLKELNENVCAKKQHIKEKERILAELRLVETYKKLHDIDKLENSIEIWRKGFKEAFTDLHCELKVDCADGSTSALLNKIVIPESIKKSCSFK